MFRLKIESLHSAFQISLLLIGAVIISQATAKPLSFNPICSYSTSYLPCTAFIDTYKVYLVTNSALLAIDRNEAIKSVKLFVDSADFTAGYNLAECARLLKDNKYSTIDFRFKPPDTVANGFIFVRFKNNSSALHFCNSLTS